MFIPMFPLELVLFPGETLNLHIFEPRYKQLIQDCCARDATFGIPAFIGGSVAEFGTEAAVVGVEKTYENGEMDIRVAGRRAFHGESFHAKLTGKLYGGGDITFIENDARIEPRDLDALKDKYAQLHEFLETPQHLRDLEVENPSFRIGHYVGFSLKQKVRMLSMPRERDREKKILNHLDHILPMVANLAESRRRARENGHFKILRTLDLGPSS